MMSTPRSTDLKLLFVSPPRLDRLDDDVAEDPIDL